MKLQSVLTMIWTNYSRVVRECVLQGRRPHASDEPGQKVDQSTGRNPALMGPPLLCASVSGGRCSYDPKFLLATRPRADAGRGWGVIP